MKSKLKTPLGEFIILLNGKEIEYTYKRIENRYNEKDVFLIEINFSNLNVNDIIECFVKECNLKYYDGNERCDLLTMISNTFTLGVCGYEPQYHDCERLNYCYELDNYMDGKFVYKVHRNPSDYDNENNKESCVARIKICWLNNKKYIDAEETLFDILC